MTPPAPQCDLCSLPLPDHAGAVTLDFSGTTYRFCCIGCRQVFRILLEAAGSADPAAFRQTELFQECRRRGIIPAGPDDIPPPPADDKHREIDEDIRKAAVEDGEGLALRFDITNMWCPACAWVIEETLRRMPGVHAADCNFSTDRVFCTYDPLTRTREDIESAVEKLGYRLRPIDAPEDSTATRRHWIRFAISAFLTVNVMMLSFSLYSGFFMELGSENIRYLSWPLFVMASVVLFYGGFEFFQKSGAAVRTGHFGMETLIVIGASTAWLYSTWNLAAGSIHLYYDTVSMLVTLVLLGKTIESRAKGKIQAGLEEMLRLQPQKIRLCTAAAPGWRYAAMEALQQGGCFQVEPGEIVPADGRVQTGAGLVDESPLTGESQPVSVQPGDALKSGTRIVSGTMTAEALQVGPQSTLGKLIESVELAVSGKTPLETRTDWLLQWFVPLVVATAAVSALGWRWSGVGWETAMIRGITVLVIACPCALGIAIPMARVAGIARAGRRGMMVRDFHAFETAAKITHCFLDKTGTMTQGAWRLKEIRPVPQLEATHALALAAGLENEVEHPVGVEIRRIARSMGVPPRPATDVTAAANGVSGAIDGRRVRIGSASFLQADNDPETWRLAWQNRTPTDTVVYMSLDRQAGAGFLFGDELRGTARSAVDRLKQRGLGLTLISGDHPRTTTAVGAALGIERCEGHRQPEEKRRQVARAQGQGDIVAMVGDGINDAPAMVQADLSIAVPAGSFPGEAAADVILLRRDPAQVAEFLDLARQTDRKIRQNLIFTFAYNTLSIPIAVSGLLSPLVAVSAMLMSSISVIGNTLLLLRDPAPQNDPAGENP